MPSLVAHHFENLEQQSDAKTLGLWMFLASEILFFGTLFTSYAVMRTRDPDSFALAASKLNGVLGGINTAVLLTSSFTMALAVWAAEVKKQHLLRLFLGLTLALGSVFLAIKFYEWHDEYTHHLFPGAGFGRDHSGEVVLTNRQGAPLTPYKLAGVEMAMVMYFIITALHALHMVVGLFVLGTQWCVRPALPGLRRQGLLAHRAERAVLALRGHRVDLRLARPLPLQELKPWPTSRSRRRPTRRSTPP